VPLSKACKTIYRYPSFYGLERHDQGVPVVRGEHLLPNGTISTDFEDYWFVTEECSSRFPKTRLELHDVAMSVRGSIGTFARVGTAHVGAQISPNLIRLSPDPQVVDPVFFYYALMDSAAGAFIASTSSSSAVPAIRAADIKLAMIPVPPLPDQRAIAHILSAFDDKIELNLRLNETLEVMARALFKSWFIDFDPVRAKAEGRDPGLPADIATLFPDSFEDSELGEIPKGWKTGLVEDLAEASSGKRPGVRYPEASVLASVPLWGGNGPMAFVPEALIDYPFLLTGRVGTLGSVFRITEPCWPSDNTLILKTKQRRAFEYLFLQLKRVDFMALNRGSTQPLLTQTDLKAQPLLTPPTAVLEYFHVFAGSLYEQIDELESEVRTLAAVRDTLLPKLLSGELRVKGVDQSMEAHV